MLIRQIFEEQYFSLCCRNVRYMFPIEWKKLDVYIVLVNERRNGRERGDSNRLDNVWMWNTENGFVWMIEFISNSGHVPSSILLRNDHTSDERTKPLIITIVLYSQRWTYPSHRECPGPGVFIHPISMWFREIVAIFGNLCLVLTVLFISVELQRNFSLHSLELIYLNEISIWPLIDSYILYVHSIMQTRIA